MNGTAPSAALMRILSDLDFDVAQGVELCGGDNEFYCDLIRELHSDVLVQRSRALGSTDPEARKNYAHLLKGTLQVLGEKRASQDASDLEQAIRKGEAHDELIRKLLDELDLIDRSLGTFFSRPA